MIKLSKSQLIACQADWENRVQSAVLQQARGRAYREDIEALIFENDVADDFLGDVKSRFDTLDFDDTDLIEWIRDVQHSAVQNTPLIAIPLSQFIFDKFNDSQSKFAKAQGIKKQQVTKWLNEGFIVIDGHLFSKRRDLMY